jgi:hypothetical protein
MYTFFSKKNGNDVMSLPFFLKKGPLSIKRVFEQKTQFLP